MAPIRRYLRITKFSVLEVRIYLHKPSDTAWLLSSRDDVLARIIAEVRPKVLPKLREENENARKKGSKKKRGIKDVASQEDFEVSIFLKETSSRHSLLTKRKEFVQKERIRSTGRKLLGEGADKENAIRVEDGREGPEDEDGDVVLLKDIPEKSKKRKGGDEEEDALFVSSSDEEFFTTQKEKGSKRRKQDKETSDTPEEETGVLDDKKKLQLDTSYDGFSIYGRILCLIVTRKNKKDPVSAAGVPVGGSQMMEQWIGTQAAQEAGLLDDGEG